MTDWTAKRLDALPEFTAVEYDISPDVPMRLIRIHSHPSSWVTTTGVLCASELLAAMSEGRIRVVSVPIDALLTDEAVEAARWHSGLGSTRYGIERMLRAAIAHVTGGAS